MTMNMTIRSRCWKTCCLSVLLFLLAQLKTVAQESTIAGVNDTLRFLRVMLLQKHQYIGQPFSKIEAYFDQINKKMQFFSPSASRHWDKNTETDAAFFFNRPREFDDFRFPHLIVYWQTPFPIAPSDVIYNKKSYLPNGVNWTQEASQHYRDKIVARIVVKHKDGREESWPQ